MAFNQQIKYTGFSINNNVQITDVQIVNQENYPVYFFELIAKKTITVNRLNLHFQLEQPPNFILSNGFQSWSECLNVKKGFRKKNLWNIAKPLIANMGDYHFNHYPESKNITSSWHYSLANFGNNKIFVGSLSPKIGYCLFTWDKELNTLTASFFIEKTIQTNQKITLKIFIDSGTESELYHNFFNRFPNLKSNNQKQKFTGWTSWYNYYTDINHSIITENAQNFTNNKIPIDYFQIDDGWQTAIGDWEINDKFHKGLKPIVNNLIENNIKPGLWLAPFIAEKKSKVAQQNPHWLIKDENGKNIKVGYNPLWSGWFYALDTEQEEVKNYIAQFLRRVVDEWSFKLLKLDFLYSAGVIPRNNKSRGQLMYEAMQWLRDILKDVEILGCGVPLNTAFNTTDFCRIGPDISHTWDVKWLKMVNHSERLSTKNAINNVILRSPLDNLPFKNDPDVFLLRDENQKLNFNQKFTLFLINQIFGSLIFTSDNINRYNKNTMRLYQSQFPAKPLEVVGTVFNDNLVTINFKNEWNSFSAICNLSNKSEKVNLTDDCFEQNIFQNAEAPQVVGFKKQIKLDAYQSKLFIKNNPNQPFQVIGSSSHVFAGNELESLEIKNKLPQLKFYPQAQKGFIVLKTPDSYKIVEVNNH